MRILFDQGTPLPLKDWLAVHHVETAWQRGWSELSNGELLVAAENATFDLFVTTDQNLCQQQNLSQRGIAVLVLMVANWPALEPHAKAIASVTRPVFGMVTIIDHIAATFALAGGGLAGGLLAAYSKRRDRAES